MKQYRKIWASICIVAFVCCMSLVLFKLQPKKINTEKKQKSVSETINPGFGELDEDDFVILEVVPDTSYARLGYYLAGAEPINIFEACVDGKADEVQALMGGTEFSAKKKTITGSQYKRLKNAYGEDLMKQYWTRTSSGSAILSNVTYEFKDKKEFVINNSGLQTILASQAGNDTIVIVTVTSEQLNSFQTALKDNIDKIDMFYMSETYSDKSQYILAEKYLSLKIPMVTENGEDSFGNAIQEGRKFTSEGCDLSWDVVSTIMECVGSKTETKPLIMDKNMYTIALEQAKKVNQEYASYQYSLNRSVKYSSSTYKIWATSSGKYKDEALFLCHEDFLNDKKVASQNNAYKLYLMSMFRDPAEFYNLFIESGLIVEDGKYKLQSSTGEDNTSQMAWSTYTFLPARKEIKSDDHIEGDETFWTTQMNIELQQKSDPIWRNCCVLSLDMTAELADAKEVLKQVCMYQPLSGISAEASETNTRTFNVLEIEAAVPKSGEVTGAEIEQFLPYTGYTKAGVFKVNVTTMATAEFNCVKEELTSKYDLIYIGDNITGFRSKEVEKTINNKKVKTKVVDYGSDNEKNKLLRGLIYTVNGPFVTFNYDQESYTSKLTTYVNSDSPSSGQAFFTKEDGESALRYSGTDIVTEKKTQLENFVQAGLPVIVDEDLYNDAVSTTPRSVENSYQRTDYFGDTQHNHMYQFIKSQKDKVINGSYNYRMDTAGTILKRITKQKPKMILNAIRTTGTEGTNKYPTETVKLSDCLDFRFSNDDRSRQFIYNVSIDNPENPGATFMAKFYVDSNADGIFSAGERMVTRKFVLNSSNNITINMNSNYRGAFSWKLEVYPQNNEYMKCIATGYDKIHTEGVTDGKQDVYVLQVRSWDSDSMYGTEWSRANRFTIDIAKDFKKELEKLEDYNIHIDLVELQNFSNSSWRSTKLGKNVNHENLRETDTSKLAYDMIVFGFADSYRSVDLTGSAAKSVEDFISNGHSVLYSHDLATQHNEENPEDNVSIVASKYYTDVNTGYTFNKYLRDSMGQNRYKQSGASVSKKFFSANNYTYTTPLSSKEKAYGFTYTCLMQYSNYYRAWYWGDGKIGKDSDVISSGQEYWGPYKGLYENLYADNPHWSSIENGYETHYVTQVNEGQITKYPNDLGKISSSGHDGNGNAVYKIANTHGQAYQCNIEDPNTIVWLTLADKSDSKTKWYRTSPNDGANNYYVYNRGNVTYSGIGHRNGTKEGAYDADDDLTTFEKKLFVNVFVAALRAGVQGPQPEITNAYTMTENNRDYQVVFADVDADSEEQEFAMTEDVNFYIPDDSSNSDHVYVTVQKQVYDEDKKEYKYVEITDQDIKDGFKIEPKSPNVYEAVKGPASFPAADGNHYGWEILKTDLNTAEKTYEYTLKYPRKYLQNNNEIKFRICAYSKKANKDESIMGYQDAKLARRAFFNLD